MALVTAAFIVIWLLIFVVMGVFKGNWFKALWMSLCVLIGALVVIMMIAAVLGGVTALLVSFGVPLQ